MGVYVKGMDMPKSCCDCDIGVCICNRYYDPKFTSELSERHPDCPLVEVKTPHGRLIDADALEQNAQERMLICNQNDNQFQKPYEVMRAIALAPTIIPAEEGEP